MNLVIVILAAAAVVLLAIGFSGKKNAFQVSMTAPAQSRTAEAAVDPVEVAVNANRNEDLEKLFHIGSLSSTSKARLLDVAITREDEQLSRQAAEMLREMVLHGGISDVLAALPKATHFSEETAMEIASLQESLCRFQSSAEDDLGFEMIKLKFNLVFKARIEIKPWQTICRAS